MSAVESVSKELVVLVRGLRELHGTVALATQHPVDVSGAAILGRLELLGRSRLSTLAAALSLDISTVSRQVPVLERYGWVSRERDAEDHRASLLDLTAAGQAVLDDVRRARTDVLTRLLPDWTDAELAAFAGQLSRFNADVSSNRSAVVLISTGTDTR